MKKFKQLIYAILGLGLVRTILNYDTNLSGTLNELISVCVVVVILTTIYWLIKSIKISKNKSLETTNHNYATSHIDVSSIEVNMTDSSFPSVIKKTNFKRVKNNKRWGIISSICVGSLIGGAAGFFIGSFILELSGQLSDALGWIGAFSLILFLLTKDGK